MHTSKKKCLIPMRLQPLHKGHLEILKQLEKEFEEIYVLLGTDKVPKEKNPFSFLDRREILYTYCNISRGKLFVIQGKNFKKDEDWIKYIVDLMHWHEIETFACSSKENYEKWFENEPTVNVKKYGIETQVNATKVRAKLDEICDFMLKNEKFLEAFTDGSKMLPNNSSRYYMKKLIILKLQERLEV